MSRDSHFAGSFYELQRTVQQCIASTQQSSLDLYCSASKEVSAVVLGVCVLTYAYTVCIRPDLNNMKVPSGLSLCQKHLLRSYSPTSTAVCTTVPHSATLPDLKIDTAAIQGDKTGEEKTL